MKLPNWFKIAWWVALSTGLTTVVYGRLHAIQEGTATGVDALLGVLLIVLLLLPLFGEFDLFGVRLKAQINEVRSEVREQFSSLRNEIISIGVNTQFNPQINLAPPPDSQLPALEERFQEILNELRRTQNIARTVDVQTELLVPSDVNYLFIVRYSIERELRQIWKERFDPLDIRRPASIHKILEAFRNAELIDSRFAGVVREVYSVCSPAIHGEPVSKQQITFVKEIAPNLISTLIEIRGGQTS